MRRESLPPDPRAAVRKWETARLLNRDRSFYTRHRAYRRELGQLWGWLMEPARDALRTWAPARRRREKALEWLYEARAALQEIIDELEEERQHE